MYVAITTTNARQNGYRQVCQGEIKADLRDAAERKICGNFWGKAKPIEIETELINLRIVTATEARRKYKIT